MKEIVIISGKGGTGKTSITASFAEILKQDTVLADCDVDAADMHLLMKPNHIQSEEFYSGYAAKINPELCTNCGVCAEKCRFNAIELANNQHTVNNLDCEGCGYCAKICPTNAIEMNEQKVGQWYISKIKTKSFLVHAHLSIGAENSGKLVAKVKSEAKALAEKKQIQHILVDGSPGVGCPVVSSLSGAHFVILVTEPTVSGLHDLKRVYELVQKFNIPAGCIINKSDINPTKTEEIIRFLEEEKIHYISKIPYNDDFTKALTNGLTITEHNPKGELSLLIYESWKKIKNIINN